MASSKSKFHLLYTLFQIPASDILKLATFFQKRYNMLRQRYVGLLTSA